MKVLMLSTDRKILEQGSSVRARMQFLSEAADELHVLVLGGAKKTQERISEKCIVYSIPVPHKLLIPFFACRAARRLADKHSIVTSQDEFIGIAGYFLKRFHGVPWEAQVHTDIASVAYKTFSLQNRLRSILARYTYPYATRMRVVSKRVKFELEKWKSLTYVPKTVLPVFIDANEFTKLKREESEKFRILSVSRLEPEKRIDELIRAFAVFCVKNPKSELIVAGDGAERRKLENLAQSLGVNDHVQFLGHVEDVGSLYKNADVYVLNSAYESYGRTIIEALLSGLPVISTDVGIVREVVEVGGLGHVITNNEELLEKMKWHFTNKDISIRMGEKGRQAVSEIFVKEAYLKKLKENWANVLEQT